MSFLADMGRVSRGIDKAAVTQAQAEVARVRGVQANMTLDEQIRQRQVNEATRRQLEELANTDPAAFNEAILAQQQQPSGAGLRIGAGQQPRPNMGVNAQGVPNAVALATPQQTPAAPATPPIAPPQTQPQSTAPVPARERDAQTQTTQATQPAAQPERTPGVQVSTRPVEPQEDMGLLESGWEATRVNRERISDRWQEAEGPAQHAGAALANVLDGLWGYAKGVGTVAGGIGAAHLGYGAELLRGAGIDVPEARRTTQPEAAPAAETPPVETAPETEQAAPTTVEANEQEVASTTNAQVVRQVVQNDTAPSGMPTRQVPENIAFYAANPQHITPDMQHAMRQREITKVLAMHHIRSNNFDVAGELMMGVAQMDQNMFALQGMQGVQELNYGNDPRRLNQVLSYYNGVDTQIVPHRDGSYHIEQAGQIIRDQLNKDQVSTLAARVFSQSARDNATAMQKSYAERMMEFQFWSQEKAIELRNELSTIAYEGNINAHIERIKAQYGGELGIQDLHNGPNGEIIATVRNASGVGEVMLYNPAQPEQRPGLLSRINPWSDERIQPPLGNRLTPIDIEQRGG